jgi:hypothetical protein
MIFFCDDTGQSAWKTEQVYHNLLKLLFLELMGFIPEERLPFMHQK